MKASIERADLLWTLVRTDGRAIVSRYAADSEKMISHKEAPKAQML